jgi:serine-type D-Ala-D-Ala carboxypeptidase/endopeptidase (penicillin-binding protein 4)
MQSRRSKPALVASLALMLTLGVGVDAVADLRVVSRADALAKGSGPAGASPAVPADALQPIPAVVLNKLRSSGVPLDDFGIHVRAVDTPMATMSLNGEQTFLLASTTKVVTSLAALNLLGAEHQWRTRAYSATPVRGGRIAGDLVISGGKMGMTPAQLRRWFLQMRGEGLSQVSGRILLDQFSLLHDIQPTQLPVKPADAATGSPPSATNYNQDASVVVVQATKAELAKVSLRPGIPGVDIVNEMLMGGISGAVCGARVRWGEPPTTTGGGLPPLVVSGRWVADCGQQEVAFVKLPTANGSALMASTRSIPLRSSATPEGTGHREAKFAPEKSTRAVLSMPDMVASLWAEAGGQLRGGVVEAERSAQEPTKRRASEPSSRAAWAWSSQSVISMPEAIRELNKTSNNDAARELLLSLATPAAPALSGARGRVGAWLRDQGLAQDDITVDEGSGQSRRERGRPRALVQLLVNQWWAKDARIFVDSLPIAGVDGTLANRMGNGPATGRAFMKTGTLSDTRALAGYVMGNSGKVYAVALMVNHPQAARAASALDSLVEWLAKNG